MARPVVKTKARIARSCKTNCTNTRVAHTRAREGKEAQTHKMCSSSPRSIRPHLVMRPWHRRRRLHPSQPTISAREPFESTLRTSTTRGGLQSPACAAKYVSFTLHVTNANEVQNEVGRLCQDVCLSHSPSSSHVCFREMLV